jgi:hypothetical protein
MSDFTLPAPGTTSNPYTPPGCIVAASTIKSDATGIRAGVTGTYAVFAHNANYGPIINSTIALAAWQSAGDNALVGGVIRQGPNEGGFIGMYLVGTQSAVLCWESPLGVKTNISAGLTLPALITAGDIYSCTISNSGSLWTITAQQNGTSLGFTGGNTSAQWSSEASIAAGWGFDPQDVNGTYFSQVTGTGVAGGPPTGIGGFMSPGISSPC